MMLTQVNTWEEELFFLSSMFTWIITIITRPHQFLLCGQRGRWGSFSGSWVIKFWNAWGRDGQHHFWALALKDIRDFSLATATHSSPFPQKAKRDPSPQTFSLFYLFKNAGRKVKIMPTLTLPMPFLLSHFKQEFWLNNIFLYGGNSVIGSKLGQEPWRLSSTTYMKSS